MASGQNQRITRVDTWHDVGHTSNLSLSWYKRGMREKKIPFQAGSREREREEKREDESQASF